MLTTVWILLIVLLPKLVLTDYPMDPDSLTVLETSGGSRQSDSSRNVWRILTV